MIDIKNFMWGKVLKVHKIGEYQILEVNTYNFDDQYGLKRTTRNIFYHPFINEKDTNASFDTLDEAIVYAISRKNEGLNGRAHEYFWKMIK